MSVTIDIKNLRLAAGSHRSPEQGMCVMELASYIAHKPFSDRPPCVSPAIGAFLRSWNDSLNDDDRQMLKPYAWKVLNTRTTNADEKIRGLLATDWLVRVFTPAWLDLAGLADHAQALRDLPQLESRELAMSAQPIIDDARSAARSAYSAADSAAYAAYSAARSAYSAADSAAYAARSAYSAADSAGLAAYAAYSAARSASKEALAATVEELQPQALELLDRMIAVGKVGAYMDGFTTALPETSE